ncbi:CRISPR-associated protein Cas4 [Bordetella petrii]|nr:CRISPR-associated protein Cas4 [Bordetella petrii]
MNDNFIPISALQHYLYCPRQCALIHVEQQWAENRHTAEGRLLHDRADTVQTERRRGVRTITAMPLSNAELGIHGVADVVEVHQTDHGEMPHPVEYKRGRPKKHHADEVQLCAQALCLETMFGCRVESGALFYGQPRRRQSVTFGGELRRLTLDTIIATRNMIHSDKTPSARYQASRCNACSLITLCQPKLLNKRQPVNTWLREQIAQES